MKAGIEDAFSHAGQVTVVRRSFQFGNGLRLGQQFLEGCGTAL